MTEANLPLAGKVVLVTGASRGIGAGIVERLAREGAKPIIHYGRDQRRASALLDRIGGAGWTVQADLADPAGPTELWNRAVELAGRVHALVNNAGIRTEISVDSDLPSWHDAWQREFQVNFFAAADLCRMAIRHFREHGGGRIINMASRAGQRGYAADALPYGAAKAAFVLRPSQRSLNGATLDVNGGSYIR
jgi:3-oxoacyl-[acyl-carrier protein] reductase